MTIPVTLPNNKLIKNIADIHNWDDRNNHNYSHYFNSVRQRLLHDFKFFDRKIHRITAQLVELEEEDDRNIRGLIKSKRINTFARMVSDLIFPGQFDKKVATLPGGPWFKDSKFAPYDLKPDDIEAGQLCQDDFVNMQKQLDVEKYWNWVYFL